LKKQGFPVEKDITSNFESFHFRNLHPRVFLGTASDRYAGWTGQIYSEGRYRISSRSKRVGGKTFKEEILPVESVAEYFQHFSILELDFTFYRLLLDKGLKPSPSYHTLQAYVKHLNKDDSVILKVPQLVFAQRLWRGGQFMNNPDYLNPAIFNRQFYEPAIDLLGDFITGFIFEQEYQPKKERTSPEEYSEMLASFLDRIPTDDRYHIETRTDPYLSDQYFGVLEKYGAGQVLSHWTWLPPLGKQFLKSKGRFLNSGGQCIIRLMTPLKMRYSDSYKNAYPFDRLVDGMLSPQMVEETVEIMSGAIEQGVKVNVVINNRAGGNAPLVARKISDRFFELNDPY